MHKVIGISGGNGFVGSEVIKEALNLNLKVISFERLPKTSSNYSVIQFNLGNPEALEIEKIRGIDIFVHTAALVHKTGFSDEKYLELNKIATQVLFKKCVDSGVKHFIFLSTVGVYGVSSSNNPLSIDSEVKPITPYQSTKLASEAYLIKQIKRKRQINVTVLRLPLIYGENAPGNYGSINRLAQSFIPLPFKGVQNKRSMISVNNVAKVIVNMGLQKIRLNGLHLLTEEELFSTESLVMDIRKKTGKAKALFFIPKFVMKLLLLTLGKNKKYEQLYEDLVVLPTISLKELLP